jgi:hypothetical protein
MQSLPVRQVVVSVVGMNPVETSAVATGWLKKINLGGTSESELLCFITKDSAEGTPGVPSMKMDRANTFEFFWPVSAGSHDFSVSVKQAANLSPRPRVTIIANAECGVNANSSATAAAGAGWVTIGPITITPSSDGAVRVRLENMLEGIHTPCFWDNISVT